MILDNVVDQQEVNAEPQSLDDLLGEMQEEEAAAAVKAPEPTSRWRETDIDGNKLYVRPRSSWNQSTKGQYYFFIQDILNI